MVAAAQGAIEQHQLRAALLEQRDHLVLIVAARCAGHFHVAGFQCLDDEDLAHGAVDTRVADLLDANLGSQQGIAGRGDQAAWRDTHWRLGNGEHFVAVFTIAANGCDGHGFVVGMSLMQQVIEADRLARVLGHAHHGDGLHAHGVHALP